MCKLAHPHEEKATADLQRVCKAGLTASVCKQSAGQLKPGAKGLSLTTEQFASVRQAEPAISAALVAGDTSYELPLSDKCALCCHGMGRAHGAPLPASDVVPVLGAAGGRRTSCRCLTSARPAAKRAGHASEAPTHLPLTCCGALAAGMSCKLPLLQK